MPIDVRIVGPGLDVVRRLAEGDGEIVLGRDTGCHVCLPDPERTVSRRHLALWATGGELYFHVLSVVNGIEMPFGEAPPGARGVLPAGQRLKIGGYEVSGAAVEESEDPWAVLDREGSGFAPLPGVIEAAAEDDPFGDWGFQTTFGDGMLDAASLDVGDVSAFFAGLGVEVGKMSRGELEAIGRLVRLLVQGVLDLHRESPSGDGSCGAPSGDSPLKTDGPLEPKLRYLFGGYLAASGHAPPERAMRELIADLARVRREIPARRR